MKGSAIKFESAHHNQYLTNLLNRLNSVFIVTSTPKLKENANVIWELRNFLSTTFFLSALKLFFTILMIYMHVINHPVMLKYLWRYGALYGAFGNIFLI